MINIAIVGFGTVGSGVAEIIKENSAAIAQRLDNEKLNVKYILDLRDFPGHELADRVVHDINVILNDKDVTIVVETMGGSHPAYEFSKSFLESGKSVVTSNKEVVATFGADLMRIARENEVSYLFEASVGGGIPIIRPMWQCLAANKIVSVTGILNGTCNYILTKMETQKQSLEQALSVAQSLGYAEANPAADIEGTDTLRKISILSSLAYGKHIQAQNIECSGIVGITYEDIQAAKSMGYRIKLLGRYEDNGDGTVYAITAPHLVSYDNPLSSINDVYNGICVKGNMVEDVMFCGRGAGKLPTASAVMADVLDIIRDCKKTIGWQECNQNLVCDIKTHLTSYYVRTVACENDIAQIFPEAQINNIGNENVFITPLMKQSELDEKIKKLGKAFTIRVLQ